MVVSTRWKNILREPKREAPSGRGGLKNFGRTGAIKATASLDEIRGHLFLEAGGKRTAPVSPLTDRLPNALTAKRFDLAEYGDEAEGEVAFRVRKDDLESLTLVLLDPNYGNIRLALEGSGERVSEPPAVGTQSLANVRISVYGWQCNKDTCTVELGLESAAERTTVHYDLIPFTFLVEDGHYYWPALDREVAYSLQGFERFHPGWERRGVLVFPAPPDGRHLGLFFGLENDNYLSFELTADRSRLQLAEPVSRFEDGNTASFEIIGAELTNDIEGIQPGLEEVFLAWFKKPGFRVTQT